MIFLTPVNLCGGSRPRPWPLSWGDLLRASHEADGKANAERAVNGGPETIFVRTARAAFEQCRSKSIDYAVTQKHDDVYVLPFEWRSTDLGGWNAVADLTSPDADQNRVHAKGDFHRARNACVQAPHRPVALGTRDLLIVGVGERFQVNRIGVKPGASLSLQKHYYRAERWVVVKRTAEVTIPVSEVYRRHNPGKMALEMIEVQSGAYLESRYRSVRRHLRPRSATRGPR